MPKYIIYKTTNTVNGKFYIGKHKVADVNERLYLGSGHQITAAVKKYGKENFIRETLYEFDDENECIEKEKEIVTLELTKNPKCYNIATGGNAGKTQSEQTKKMISEAVSKEWTNNEQRKEKTRQLAIERSKQGKWGPTTVTNEGRNKISDNTKKYWNDPEHKSKRCKAISDSLIGKPLSPKHIESNKLAQNKTKYCEFCEKDHKIAAYARWHGKKCKNNLENGQ